jgi:hypothetical protein
MNQPHVLIFFIDGVGLGPNDPATNPFAAAQLPNLTALLGDKWYIERAQPVYSERATLIPTDANLGMDGRPQSATGQAAILTGRNVPALIGRHWGPWPVEPVADIIRQGTLFSQAIEAGKRTTLLNPYPQRYFDTIASGKRMYSSVTLAAAEAGVRFLTVDDLRAGLAVSPGFTNDGWRTELGVTDMPLLTPAEAGERLARLAQAHDFAFFDHWLTDIRGHRGSLEEAVAHVEMIDAVIGGMLAAWDDAQGLLIITSDHGNIEDKERRTHTRNLVPTILVGPDHRQRSAEITDLTHIAPLVRTFLTIE